jgi:hypothetical protein
LFQCLFSFPFLFLCVGAACRRPQTKPTLYETETNKKTNEEAALLL